MARYALRRLLLLIPTLVGMSVLIFAMVRLLPGDVVDAMFTGEAGASASAKQALRKALGLADPLPVQYLKFVGGVVTGSLGQSLTSGEPVSRVMARAIRPAASEAWEKSVGKRISVGRMSSSSLT